MLLNTLAKSKCSEALRIRGNKKRDYYWKKLRQP